MRRLALLMLLVALVPAAADAAPKRKRAPKKGRAAQSAPAVVAPRAPAVVDPPGSSTSLPSTANTTPMPADNSSPFGDTSKIKVAVMNLRASADFPPDLLESMAALIAQELVQMGPFAALAMQDVLQMINFESMRQSLGCDAASCLAEVGGALGADYMISGNLALVGKSYLLQLQLMDMRESNVVARVARDYDGAPTGLLDEVRVSTRMLVRDLLAKKSGRLLVATAEEGATVAVDGVVLGVTPLREPLTLGGGTHTVTLDKRGFVRFARDVAIAEGTDTRVDAFMQPSEDYLLAYREKARFTRRLAWAGVITGGVGLVAGGALYAKGASDASGLKKDVDAYNAGGLRDSGTAAALTDRDASIGRLDTLAVISAGIGVAALATGIVLFVTGDDPVGYDTKTQVLPNVLLDGQGGAYFAFSGRF